MINGSAAGSPPAAVRTNHETVAWALSQFYTDDTFHLNIVRRQIMYAGVFQPFAMTIADMRCRQQTNHGGACGTARDDPFFNSQS